MAEDTGNRKMHKAAYELMNAMLSRYEGDGANVLDVGSYDVNGCYRPLIEGRGWSYTGLDIEAGPNVDIVAKDPYNFPMDDNTYDILISGSTMEHVEATWKWIPELVRVLKPGGLLCITTHWSEREHRYPVDCWRIMPDGMRYIFNETGQLADYWIAIMSHTDIIGSARKNDVIH